MHQSRHAVLLIACLVSYLLAAHAARAQRLDADTLRLAYPACVQSPVPAGHAFMAVSVLEGDTLANVLVGAKDEPSSIVRVRIAPGERPISVVLLSQSGSIWAFEGAVERLRRVVVLTWEGGTRAALTGLAGDIVEFGASPGCRLRKLLPMNLEVEQQKEMLAAIFGRQPDHAVIEGQAHLVTLDTGITVQRSAHGQGVVIKQERSDGSSEERTITRDPQGRVVERTTIDRRSLAERELYSSYPGGVRELDPKAVLSPFEITVPELLPGHAGLAQLERAGAIRRVRADEIADWNERASGPYRSKLFPRYTSRVRFAYAITRDITFPVGLHGSIDLNFLVLAGVPMPRGKPGSGCVAQIQQDAALGDTSCFGDEREAIERLRKLPSPENLSACRMFEPPATASLEAVSAYESEVENRRRGGDRIPAPIIVRVSKPGSVVLVLNNYSPVIWRVSTSSDAHIAGVLLTGYYTSSVEGIPPDTPVVVLDWQGREKRPKPDASCSAFHDFLGANYEAGPRGLLLDRQVQAVTGRSLDGFQGAYRLKEVDIR